MRQMLMVRDAFWIVMLFAVMGIITASGLSHSSAFRSASFAPQSEPAMIEQMPAPAPDPQPQIAEPGKPPVPMALAQVKQTVNN